eukprot:scaffold186995_cov43-Prasinocladus_malaysianus.AAC.2
MISHRRISTTGSPTWALLVLALAVYREVRPRANQPHTSRCFTGRNIRQCSINTLVSECWQIGARQVGASRLASYAASLVESAGSYSGLGRRSMLQTAAAPFPEYIIAGVDYSETGTCPDGFKPAEVCADPSCEEWQCVDSDQVPAVVQRQCV